MEPFKELFNLAFITTLASEIKIIHTVFDETGFIDTFKNKEYENKELKDRMRTISITLGKFLPNNYISSLEILKQVKPKFESLQAMIFQDFVEVYGLDYPQVSLEVLELFTINSSCEFAIRHFIINNEDLSLEMIMKWTQSKIVDIRRLASEGIRTRLPWAISLPLYKKDPTNVFKVIEALKNDESLYVRKSVANSLNDISKDNPTLVIDFAKRNINSSKELDWIIKHGCRTLLKSSNKDILTLFGYEKKDITINKFKCEKEVRMGSMLEFSFIFNSLELLGKLRIEYAIDLVRLKGKTSRKVFKLSEGNFKNNIKEVSKKHSFKEVTTRKYYEGKHHLHLIVNGYIVKSCSFLLVK